MTSPTQTGTTLDLEVPTSGGQLAGQLVIPPGARGIVLFAHGSGSSRFSPRNIFVAQRLHDYHLGTLLFDLLTEREAADRANVFNIALLAQRLGEAMEWIGHHPQWSVLHIGLFGASTGAGAALAAAAAHPDHVRAVVSRGGRPDLAGPALRNAKAPTLLIVGSLDPQVLDLNRSALATMTCEKHLVIIPGASHLFEEPGKLEEVAILAGQWFADHMID